MMTEIRIGQTRQGLAKFTTDDCHAAVHFCHYDAASCHWLVFILQRTCYDPCRVHHHDLLAPGFCRLCLMLGPLLHPVGCCCCLPPGLPTHPSHAVYVTLRSGPTLPRLQVWVLGCLRFQWVPLPQGRAHCFAVCWWHFELGAGVVWVVAESHLRLHVAAGVAAGGRWLMPSGSDAASIAGHPSQLPCLRGTAGKGGQLLGRLLLPAEAALAVACPAAPKTDAFTSC